ncbi:MipA/OmpV family protein [Hyphobacterium sp. HN65]|uniref:MipA/OmpV family protein n=1 Tax=Hyphobacterium lacteum TaxID=3116575 RepID=A0ABU7LUD4_9PROT|nr:MipA/OmpV family protein [Hyphobacterium sp. HN65]MEE2526949.1 MipA/OmpV family protein [Hyphobacterium sp. HN65]
MFRLFVMAACLMSAPAFAQDEGGAPNFVAVGIAALPESPGADSYRFIPFAAGRVRTGDVVLQVEGPGLSASFLNQGPVEAGAYVRYYGGRDDDTGDVIVDLLPEADSGIVAGGFVRYQVADGLLTPFDRLYVSGRLGMDVTGEYSGVFWSGSAAYATPLSRTTLLIANLSISGTPDDYADALFSVSNVGALASGLPVFTAQSGLQDIGLTFLLDQQVTDNWSVTGIFSASRLQGDYADSPIVTIRGDEMQYFAGLGIGRRF